MNGQHWSDSGDWWTPDAIVSPARSLFGGFDLDPASCEGANRVIQARRIFTAEVNGLIQPWNAHVVWCNPPSKARSKDQSATQWWMRAAGEWVRGACERVWFVVFNPSSFLTAAQAVAYAECLPTPQHAIRVEFRQRVRYERPSPMFGADVREAGDAPPHGSALLLLTHDPADAALVARAYDHLGETLVPARWFA